MSRKRSRSPDLKDTQTPQFFSSAPISDRGSTFVGYFSATSRIETLQANPDIQSATHRIAAWRRRSSQRSLLFDASVAKPSVVYDVGHDDDGEKYAGKKLERVMIDMNVEGALVVARWYGGVMLGPVRFTHIEECARHAIKLSRANERDGSSGQNEQRIKAAKVTSAQPADREKLLRVLRERDQSVTVLRSLLDEKKKERGGETVNGSQTSPKFEQPTPPKLTDYSSIPTETLKKLEAARDATISFILQEIEKTEKATSSSPVS